MQRASELSFGATVTDTGTRFRLWAPTASSVRLHIEGRDPLSCEHDEAGWVDQVVEGIRAGARYSYEVDGTRVPDPASRYQIDDPDGPSVVADPSSFDWSDGAWRGRPWSDAVIFEAHVGTVTQEGTFAALADRLADLAATGVTALQLMPLACVPGRRNWGYDGVLLYAPEEAYGTPDDLKRLIETAHANGIMVFLDVVYNHFGPSGNYLPLYADTFFDRDHPTPWGAAINLDPGKAGPVRDFIIENALYWLEEYHFDGLRLDAVHELQDKSDEHILVELPRRVRERFGPDRHVHLILENENNDATLLERDASGRPVHHTAQWNDDIHHCWHVLLTGESDSYYAAYAEDPAERLAKCLTSGFGYQGESYGPRGGEPRGTPSGHLEPGAFIAFLQNHDQIGNRAFGDRLTTLADPAKLRMAMACLLLSPQPPMLFQGEDHGETNPFLFFCDFTDPALQTAVREGRKREFAAFPQFAERMADLPDATEVATFERSKTHIGSAAEAADVARLLALRHAHVTPLLASGWQASRGTADEGLVTATWTFAAGTLHLQMNLANGPREASVLSGEIIFSSGEGAGDTLPSWSLRFALEAAR